MKQKFLITVAFLACAMLMPVMGAQAASAVRKARIEACSGKAASDPCTFNNSKGEEVDGTCGSTRHGKLICKKGSGMTSNSMGNSMNGGAAGGSEAPPAGGDEAPAPANP